MAKGDHWGKLLLGLLGFYNLAARLTPTSKDHSIVTILSSLFIAVIPYVKKGGGTL